MQIWAKKHGRPPLGKQLGVHMCSCYQTPDRAAEGYLEVPRQLIVCVYRHTLTDILYILSVLYYQDLGRGNTNNHGRALAQLGSGIRSRAEAVRKSIQGACKVPQQQSFSTSHTQQRQVWGEPQIKLSRVLGAGGGP